ncbi:hypothetical protein FRC03_008911 [Tulasnella sp. 419]|nr:hypothetical protein FRC03_008911 [Tulasnella sp. 419]
MMQDSQQRVTAVESVSRSPEDSTIPSHTNSQSEEETISPVEVKSEDVSTKEEEVKASPINGDLEWGLDDHDFPDGGKGWLVAFGEFCMIFATFGLGNSWVSLVVQYLCPKNLFK